MKDRIQKISTEIIEFSKVEKIESRAIESCWDAIKTCYLEDVELNITPLKGNLIDNLRVRFESYNLIVFRSERYYPCFKTRIGIYSNDDLCQDFTDMDYVGYYELDMDENFKIFDNWLIFFD